MKPDARQRRHVGFDSSHYERVSHDVPDMDMGMATADVMYVLRYITGDGRRETRRENA